MVVSENHTDINLSFGHLIDTCQITVIDYIFLFDLYISDYLYTYDTTLSHVFDLCHITYSPLTINSFVCQYFLLDDIQLLISYQCN